MRRSTSFGEMSKLGGLLLIPLLLTACGDVVKEEVDCPAPCEECGECRFELHLVGTEGDDACGSGRAGITNGAVRLIQLNGLNPCIADIDRDTGGGSISFVLCDGTNCRLSEQNFAPGSPVPYDPSDPGTPWVGDATANSPRTPLSVDCYNAISVEGNGTSGDYRLNPVKSIKADFTMFADCLCNEVSPPTRNRGTIEIDAEIP